MKKKFETSDIEQYFQITNNIAPIYNDEKVHQIINSPKAMARLRGKNNNLLKITIMTTIIAVIISAVLLWPGEDSNSQVLDSRLEVSGSRLEVSDSKFQVPDSGTEVPGSGFQVLDSRLEVSGSDTEVSDSDLGYAPLQAENKEQVSEKNDTGFADVFNENQRSENKHVAMAVITEGNNDLLTDQLQTSANKQNETINALKNKPQSPPSSIKGDIEMVVADQKLLEKLGFQFFDKSVFYKNKSDKKDNKKVVYSYEVDSIGNKTAYLSNSNNFSPDFVPWSNNNFYPVVTTYRSGELVSRIQPAVGEFEMENDTLFPIYCPQGLVNINPNDFVFWYIVTDDFIQQLPIDKQAFAQKINQNKNLKKYYNKVNLIDYTQEPLVNSSTLVELTAEELFNFGFTLEKSSKFIKTVLGEIQKVTLKYEMIKNSSTTGVGYNLFGSETYNKSINKSLAGHPLLVFVTNIYGDFDVKFDTKDLADIHNLIPIIVKKETFSEAMYKDRIYWFEISDKLFKSLPERISTDLRKEYNYIIAEDKSALEKPECKYFDECKNTLEITDFKAFPNPATYEVSVSFELPETIEARISLVDLTGREKQVLHPQSQFAAGRHQLNFDLGSVPEGMYLITLYSDKGVQTQRLMVVR